jgi:threonine dehydratase
MGLEIIDQVPDVDAIIVPVGGAGLIAGVSLAVKTLKPDVIVIVSCQQ